MNFLQKLKQVDASINSRRPSPGEVALNIATLGLADLIKSMSKEKGANQNLRTVNKSALSPFSPNSRATAHSNKHVKQIVWQLADGTNVAVTEEDQEKILDVYEKNGGVVNEAVVRAAADSIREV